jgi:hypothetical protein
MSLFPIFPPSSGSSAQATFIDSAVDATNASSYTFSAKDFGSVTSDRYIIVAVNAGSGGAFTISSVTIGGVAATAIASGISSRNIAAIYIAAVPTGATGDIVVTLDGAIRRCGIGWYRATGLASAAAYSTDTDITDVSNAYSVTLNVPQGFLIATSVCEDNASMRACTWTGASENYEEPVETGGEVAHSGALNSFAAAATSQVVSAQWSGSFDDGAMAVATWS